MISHGRLSHRIRIERPESRDVPGKAAKVTEWRMVTAAWAARDAKAGGEVLAATQLVAAGAEIFTIHTQRGVTIDRSMRVVLEANQSTFAIEDVRSSADKADTILICRAGARTDS